MFDYSPFSTFSIYSISEHLGERERFDAIRSIGNKCVDTRTAVFRNNYPVGTQAHFSSWTVS